MAGLCYWCGADKENPLGLCAACFRFPPTRENTENTHADTNESDTNFPLPKRD